MCRQVALAIFFVALGGLRGLGLACARQLVGEGARVVVSARDQQGIENRATARILSDLGMDDQADRTRRATEARWHPRTHCSSCGRRGAACICGTQTDYGGVPDTDEPCNHDVEAERLGGI